MISENAIKRAVKIAHPGADPSTIAVHGSVCVFEKHGDWFGCDIKDAGRGVPAIVNVVPLGVWVEGDRPDYAAPAANSRWSDPEVAAAEFDGAGACTSFEGEIWGSRPRPGAAPPAPAGAGRGGHHDYAEPRPTPGWS
jgi:hypothetical protein